MCHLIMDAVWYHDIADRYIRVYLASIRQEYYNKAYSDYWKLNYILPRKYGFTQFNIEVFDIKMEEIHEALISDVLEGLQKQYRITEVYETNEMEVIPYEAIENYIAESIDLCIKELSCIGRWSVAETQKIFMLTNDWNFGGVMVDVYLMKQGHQYWNDTIHLAGHCS